MPSIPVALDRFLDHVKRAEPLSLAMFAAASGGLLIFQQLVSEVVEGETKGIDDAVLLALRQPDNLSATVGPPWLAHAANDITSLGGVTVLTLATILTSIYLLTVRRRALAVFVFLSVVSGWLLSMSLKLIIARQRPEIVPHLVNINDFSFPSGHAMLSAVTYLTIGGLLARYQATLAARVFMLSASMFLTLIIGVSRVFLGVHYPTDVLGGWCAGATWALSCWLIARRLISSTNP
ncbi:acid phosphatase [Rhizobium sp. 58]|nr:acid phosphatase [Rhizobium sp. 58]